MTWTPLAADIAAVARHLDLRDVVLVGHSLNNPLEVTGRRAAGLMPQARLVILAGAGHGLYRSEARRHATEIISFARALPARLPY
jgi:pimeloyl-ACP methyl ester carboxylesterase